MVTESQRSFIKFMVKIKVWRLGYQMRIIDVRPLYGMKWILNGFLKRQVVDNLHHAPCCPANHYHRQRLVFQHCTCGAKLYITRIRHLEG